MKTTADYQKLVKLGSGGTSDVWLVKDASLKIYAMKQLKPFCTSSMKQSFTHEINLLQQLHHQAIPAFRFGDFISNTFYVMEYLDGKTLSTGLQVNEKTLQVWALELLDVLLYLLRKGWIYCDLKPENLMVVKQHIYLIDYGSVQKNGTQITSVYATPGFVTPTLASKGIVDEQVMIYAFGKTMLALNTKHKQIEAITKRFDTSLSKRFYRILYNCIDLDSKHHYTSLTTLQQDVYKLQKMKHRKMLLSTLLLILIATCWGA